MEGVVLGGWQMKDVGNQSIESMGRFEKDGVDMRRFEGR